MMSEPTPDLPLSAGAAAASPAPMSKKRKVTMREVAQDNLRNVYLNMAIHHRALLEAAALNTHHVSNLRLPTDAELAVLKQKGWKSEVEVVHEDTISSALLLMKEHPDSRVGLWNFMNPDVPTGGFPEGATAQEEIVCVKTTEPVPLMNLGGLDTTRSWSFPIGDMDAIVSRDQVIFRNEDLSMMPSSEWKIVDIIASPAVDLREHLADREDSIREEIDEYKHMHKLWKRAQKKATKKAKKKVKVAPPIRVRRRDDDPSEKDRAVHPAAVAAVAAAAELMSSESEDDEDLDAPDSEPVRPEIPSMQEIIDSLYADGIAHMTKAKIQNTLLAAFYNGNDVFVAGASGCGVFGNPADKVASIMKEVVSEEPFNFMFRKLTFAITNGANRPCPNYEIFKRILAPDAVGDAEEVFPQESPSKKARNV